LATRTACSECPPSVEWLVYADRESEHLRPDLCHRHLGSGAGRVRDVAGGGAGRGQQRLPVHLAVGGDRQRVASDEPDRHQVRRHPRGQPVAQVVDVVGGGIEGSELRRPARVALGDHGGGGDPGVFDDRGGHLARFDAVARTWT
jgi:hypothetical protein